MFSVHEAYFRVLKAILGPFGIFSIFLENGPFGSSLRLDGNRLLYMGCTIAYLTLERLRSLWVIRRSCEIPD